MKGGVGGRGKDRMKGVSGERDKGGEGGGIRDQG